MTLSDLPQPTTTHEIGKMVARNAGWNYLSFGLSKALNLVTISILAHLLTPELFGIVALATLAIDYLSILNDFGLGAALVHRRDYIEEASNVVFTYNFLIAVSLTCIVLVVSPYIAMLFHEPALTPILRWLGFSFTINSLGSPGYKGIWGLAKSSFQTWEVPSSKVGSPSGLRSWVLAPGHLYMAN